ncbi:MAG: T9SS type A sorting domain-containing protein [Roseivirga sp.]|nr:T9SS type A sorting domain-containing protein [Roseivirga sp.]
MKYLSLCVLSCALFFRANAQTVITRLDSIKIDQANIWGVLAEGEENMAMTVSRGNIIYFQYVDNDLNRITEQVAVYGESDNLPQIVDHKTVFWKGSYYISFSAAGDRQLYIVKLDKTGQRQSEIITVFDQDDEPANEPGKPTNDMILITTDETLYVGHFIPAGQHNIHAFDMDLNRVTEPFATDFQLSHNNVGGGLYVNEAIHLFTGNNFGGESDLILTEWDSDFKAGAEAPQELIASEGGDANWFATGVAHDAETGYWYIGFQHLYPGEVLDEEHVDIAVFDQCFNLLYREHVNDKRHYRPHMLIRDGFLFMTYDKAGQGVFFHKYDLLEAGLGEDTCSDTGGGGNAPTITLDNISIAENQAIGTLVGELSLSEGTASGLSFSLVAGDGDDDNGLFTIDEARLLTAAVFDFETKSQYKIRVQATDGQQSMEQKFTIEITDVNEAENNSPTDIALTATAITENNQVGDKVADLSATDADANDVFQYALVAGEGSAGNVSFEIEGESLLAKEIFNYETTVSYSIRLIVTDAAGAEFEKQFVISIENEIEWTLIADGVMSFGSVPLGETKSLELTLTNEGEDSGLMVSSMLLPDDYVADKTSFTLAAGASEIVTVSFTPTVAGSSNGQLVVKSGADDLTVELTGEGELVTALEKAIISAAEISVYPNPSHDYLTISLNDANTQITELSIYGAEGGVMLEQRGLSLRELVVNLMTIKPGICFLKITTTKGVLTRRILVVR